MSGYLTKIKQRSVKILNNAVSNNLNKTKIKWKKEKSMTIVLCSKGYPGNYKKEIRIKNLNQIKLSKNDQIYHAGTKYNNNEIVSNGGRVLNITSTGKNFLNVRNRIIKIIKKIDWKAGFYRKDIGWRVIK